MQSLCQLHSRFPRAAFLGNENACSDSQFKHAWGALGGLQVCAECLMARRIICWRLSGRARRRRCRSIGANHEAGGRQRCEPASQPASGRGLGALCVPIVAFLHRNLLIQRTRARALRGAYFAPSFVVRRRRALSSLHLGVCSTWHSIQALICARKRLERAQNVCLYCNGAAG